MNAPRSFFVLSLNVNAADHADNSFCRISFNIARGSYVSINTLRFRSEFRMIDTGNVCISGWRGGQIAGVGSRSLRAIIPCSGAGRALRDDAFEAIDCQ